MAVQIFNRACLRGLFAVVLTLALGLSGEANAQSSSFNGTQATTFTLTTGTNTATFTFGPNAVIGPSTPGVTGDALTNWNVINQGQINAGASGIILNTVGGNSVINSCSTLVASP